MIRMYEYCTCCKVLTLIGNSSNEGTQNCLSPYAQIYKYYCALSRPSQALRLPTRFPTPIICFVAQPYKTRSCPFPRPQLNHIRRRVASWYSSQAPPCCFFGCMPKSFWHFTIQSTLEYGTVRYSTVQYGQYGQYGHYGHYGQYGTQ
jgi:hypothetical protein